MESIEFSFCSIMAICVMSQPLLSIQNHGSRILIRVGEVDMVFSSHWSVAVNSSVLEHKSDKHEP